MVCAGCTCAETAPGGGVNGEDTLGMTDEAWEDRSGGH